MSTSAGMLYLGVMCACGPAPQSTPQQRASTAQAKLSILSAGVGWAVMSDGRLRRWGGVERGAASPREVGTFPGLAHVYGEALLFADGEQYLDLQDKVLNAETDEQGRRDLSAFKSKMRLMEIRKPGSGFEMMTWLVRAVDLTRSSVVAKQEKASSDGYATLVAEQGLAALHAAGGGAASPTPQQLLDEGNFNYNVETRSRYGLPHGVPAASEIDSLLRLELVFDKGATSSNQLKIKSAAIHGMNAAQRKALAGRQVDAIQAPILAKFIEQDHALGWNRLGVLRDGSWTIAKDGEGNVSAISNDDHTLERQTKQTTPSDAARAVFATIGKCPEPHDS